MSDKVQLVHFIPRAPVTLRYKRLRFICVIKKTPIINHNHWVTPVPDFPPLHMSAIYPVSDLILHVDYWEKITPYLPTGGCRLHNPKSTNR